MHYIAVNIVQNQPLPKGFYKDGRGNICQVCLKLSLRPSSQFMYIGQFMSRPYFVKASPPMLYLHIYQTTIYHFFQVRSRISVISVRCASHKATVLSLTRWYIAARSRSSSANSVRRRAVARQTLRITYSRLE